MKTGWLIAGVLIAIFAFAQFLQLLGLIGVGFSIGGIGIHGGGNCSISGLPQKGVSEDFLKLSNLCLEQFVLVLAAILWAVGGWSLR